MQEACLLAPRHVLRHLKRHHPIHARQRAYAAREAVREVREANEPVRGFLDILGAVESNVIDVGGRCVGSEEGAVLADAGSKIKHSHGMANKRVLYKRCCEFWREAVVAAAAWLFFS